MRNDLWYKSAVFYQIYPRSFCDGNGDGIGDIRGIISKLDYLKELGVDCVWLSPCYMSPNDDIGYDISNYREINPEYGTMSDFEEMLEGMHERNIKLIMDLVVNHTSDEHEWFKKSIEGDEDYRDYYYWRKGKKEGVPPNNWNSCFTGDAWEYDEKSGEYYLHLFTKKQVDLNWDNPKVQQEVLDVVNYWFDKGVDGFRCDVINYISKVEGLPDDKNIFSPLKGEKYYCNGPKLHERLNFLNEEAFGKREKLFLGECGGTDTEMAKLFTKRDRHEMDMIFNFEHVMVGTISKYIPTKFKPRQLKKVLSHWQEELMNEGWNTLYLENHDQARSVSRFGDAEKYRKESAKMLATLLATLKGSMFIYEGQEIGMKNYPFNDISEFIDTATQSVFQLARKKLHLTKKFLLKAFNVTARDHARTPMQWNSDKNAGFSTSENTWMPINPDYKDWNVTSEEKDNDSVLNYYKKLINFRKNNSVIWEGDFKEYAKSDKYFYIYSRQFGEKKLLIVMNFSDKTRNLPNLHNIDIEEENYEIGNYSKTNLETDYYPYEVRVFSI